MRRALMVSIFSGFLVDDGGDEGLELDRVLLILEQLAFEAVRGARSWCHSNFLPSTARAPM